MRFLGFFLLFPSGAFPTEFSSGVTRRHFFRGRSTTLLGKVSFFPVGPSPALRLPTALCVTSGGEGQDDFGRPSPNAPGTFPTETTFGAKQSCRTALPPPFSSATGRWNPSPSRRRAFCCFCAPFSSATGRWNPSQSRRRAFCCFCAPFPSATGRGSLPQSRRWSDDGAGPIFWSAPAPK